MAQRTYNVLFLCTGNSARSILAEALLNHLGRGRFRAHSAGSHPVGRVNPLAIKLLRDSGLCVVGLRSKSWDEFARPRAPRIDVVITVCHGAAGETCPAWPGRPLTAHWGIEDPAAAGGSDDDRRRAFSEAYRELHARISRLVSLPLERLEPQALRCELARIGRTAGEGA